MRKTLQLLTGVIVLFLFLNVSPPSAAKPARQDTLPTVTVNETNVSVRTVLSIIEKQSNCSFVYSSDVIDVNRQISVKLENVDLNTALTAVFKETDVVWVINGKLVTLSTQTKPDKGRVKGKVTDPEGEPLAGVMVAENNDNYTITDSEGYFSITPSSNTAHLTFSCLGRETVYYRVKGSEQVEISMPVEPYLLDETKIVSVGYGTMRKKDLTGSVASVTGEVLNDRPQPTITEALQGRVAGLEARSTSAQPGSISVRIRGTNSISGGNDPLWIIDGFPGMQNMLNVSDIESVEVLKDASATAIYGAQGSNGVIIVTTKQGREGKTRIDYNASVGISTLGKKLDLLNASEYMTYENLIAGEELFTNEQIASAGKGTDWQDQIYHTAFTQTHSLSLTAGTSKTKVAAGVTYYDQDEIMRGTSYTRLSGRLSVSHDISKIFNFSASAIYSRTIQYRQDLTTYSDKDWTMSFALKADPTSPVYDENGNYTDLRTVYEFSPVGIYNPVNLINEREYKWTSNRYMLNGALTIKPVKGLTIRGAFNANIQNARQDNYISTKMQYTSSSITTTATEGYDITAEATATYEFTKNKHSFSAMIGSIYESDISKSLGASGSNLQTDVAGVYGIGSAESIGVPSASYSKWAILSFIGRINYSYDDRYMATVNFRADGSSRYSKGDKWGAFPSVALAWRMSNENFMKNAPVINNLKIRASWGQAGNPAISPYATMDLLTANKTVFGKGLYTIYTPSTSFVYGLKWETTDQVDVGFDLGMWKDRLRITADYYYKRTHDLLNDVYLANSTGYVSGTRNIGEMMNQGFEFQVDARIINHRNFQWDFSGNISVNRNKVVRLADHEDVYGSLQNITILSDYISLLREGEPIGVFYGYVEDGYDDQGNVRFVDFDNNGTINENDKAIIGNPNPDFTFGFSLDFRYKRFSLSAYFSGSVGNDIYSLSMASFYKWNSGRGNNTVREMLYDHWTEDNPNAKYPALTSESTAALKMSDRFVYDGSYMRLKNLSFSYSIPVEKVKWISEASVYVSAQNLWTITSYPFYDPDVNTQGGSSSVNQGVDLYSYPYSKGYTLGLKISF